MSAASPSAQRRMPGSALPVRALRMMREAIGERIRDLVDAGWKQVRVVTDHGWLLVPGDMPKTELPKYLIALCSSLLKHPLRGGLVIIGEINLGGSIESIQGLAASEARRAATAQVA